MLRFYWLSSLTLFLWVDLPGSVFDVSGWGAGDWGWRGVGIAWVVEAGVGECSWVVSPLPLSYSSSNSVGEAGVGECSWVVYFLPLSYSSSNSITSNMPARIVWKKCETSVLLNAHFVLVDVHRTRLFNVHFLNYLIWNLERFSIFKKLYKKN